MRFAVRVMVVVGVLLLAVWGPWRVNPPEPGAPPQGEQEEASFDGVRGEVVAVSDVTGQADQPIQDGYVVGIPEAAAPGLWATMDLDAPEPHELPYANLDVLPATVEDAGGTLAPIDDTGFALDVEPGTYLVCLARGHHPLHVTGCARTALAGDDRLRVTFGEGGVEVEVLD